jgi:hypothetical protein
MPGGAPGKPGGRNPGGGPGMPGGAKGIGGRCSAGAPTKDKEAIQPRNKVKQRGFRHALGGIMPIPRPAGIPLPGPTGS